MRLSWLFRVTGATVQPRHALLSFLCEHVDKPWPEWGEVRFRLVLQAELLCWRRLTSILRKLWHTNCKGVGWSCQTDSSLATMPPRSGMLGMELPKGKACLFLPVVPTWILPGFLPGNNWPWLLYASCDACSNFVRRLGRNS